MRLRVIQSTTGNVGRRALRAILRHPELELVGVYAYGGATLPLVSAHGYASGGA